MYNVDSESKYRQHMARKLASNSGVVANRWLARLANVTEEDILPNENCLDLIASLIEEVAVKLGRSDGTLALSGSVICRRAMEFGALRHQQQVTVHHLLNEYDILSQVLEQFIIDETGDYTGEFNHANGLMLMASASGIVRSVVQITINSFVSRYLSTIREQKERLTSFNTLVSHELKTPLQGASLNMELALEGDGLTDTTTDDLLRVQSSIQQAVLMLHNIEDVTTRTNADPL